MKFAGSIFWSEGTTRYKQLLLDAASWCQLPPVCALVSPSFSGCPLEPRMSFKMTSTTKYAPVAPNTATDKAEVSRPSSDRHPRAKSHRSMVWMLLSALAGVGFALGHHFFYASLDGVQVDRASVNQIWAVRIGTGLAFATKTLLVVAASIA